MDDWLYSTRRDFPALRRKLNDKPLVYLDSAATALKPSAMINALAEGYGAQVGNVHRGAYRLAGECTTMYEGARQCVAHWLEVSPEEVIFTRGATESLNLVAQAWARPRLKPGQDVLVLTSEHHANWLPWQRVCKQTGAQMVQVPLSEDGCFCMSQFERCLGPRTAIVAIAEISNVLGVKNPIMEVVERAHQVDAKVVVDGAQAVAHGGGRPGEINCDFYVFSGHKLYGPNGIGVLWGRSELLADMEPWHTGGGMVVSVEEAKSTFLVPPHRFEAGTPPIIPALGLAAAIQYLEAKGWPLIQSHEASLCEYTSERLSALPGVRVLGPKMRTVGIFSFEVNGIHPHDLGTALELVGVALRTGHLCAQPLMGHFGVQALSRASLGLYNCKDDIDVLCDGIQRAQHFFCS